MTKMTQHRFTVRLLTPAFLGDAEQSARWRTPPFKHLLRQWWRVQWAAEHGFSNDIRAMRREEGLLFGHAWLEDDRFMRDGRWVTTTARKSLVRLRLDRWDEGKLKKKSWPSDGTVFHPEVQNPQGRAIPVGSALYQGFGPLIYDRERRSTTLKANAALQAGESAGFALAVPEDAAPGIERALALMHRFGTVGGRSRNGWGSFVLIPESDTSQLAIDLPLRLWKDCLDRDWPHAIGKDDRGPLIWQTQPHENWQALMQTLAQIKIGLRTQFVFTTGRNAPAPEDRHWLSYPVTNHSVQSWGNSSRLPNTLHFKVHALPDGQLVGTIFHVPCLPPPQFQPSREAIEGVWQRVYELLDELSREPGKRAYASIKDQQRRSALKPDLERIRLQRVKE